MMNLKLHFQSPLYRYAQMPETQADGLHPYRGLGIGRFWRVIWYSHSIKSGEGDVQFDYARIVSEVARIRSPRFRIDLREQLHVGKYFGVLGWVSRESFWRTITLWSLKLSADCWNLSLKLWAQLRMDACCLKKRSNCGLT